MVAVVHFDWADLAVVVLVGWAIFRGLRQGAVLQVLSYGGFWGGLLVGSLLTPLTTRLVQSELSKAVVGLVTAFGLAFALGAVGRGIGTELWRALRRMHLGLPDAVLGGLVAAVATLLIVWVASAVLAQLPVQSISSQVDSSRIVTGLDTTLPPLPSVLARLEAFSDLSGFPQVFAGLAPESAPPVTGPARQQVLDAINAAGPSMVQVVGSGCGGIQEGSGFVVGPHLVVTNAHVVAGIAEPIVIDRHGVRHDTSTVLYDPNFDLAVLDAPGLNEQPLNIDSSLAGRGTSASALGYPGGGPFEAIPAAIRAVFPAVGRNIYGEGLTVRTVYELQAHVIPGNSGGPLVTPGGEVIGVVFSRSRQDADVGYALASPAVLQRVEMAEAHPAAVGTGACVD